MKCKINKNTKILHQNKGTLLEDITIIDLAVTFVKIYTFIST